MDFVAGLLAILFILLVVFWILSILARRHVVVMTSLPPEGAAQVCDRKFSKIAWRRVDGRGDLNYQARGARFKGAEPPVISIDIDINDASVTVVELWMSQWTTRFGMTDHVEKVFMKRWTVPKALRTAEQSMIDGPPPAANGHLEASG